MSKCVCCGINDATVSDYRTIDNTTEMYRVCKECYELSNEEWLEKKNKRVDPVDDGTITSESLEKRPYTIICGLIYRHADRAMSVQELYNVVKHKWSKDKFVEVINKTENELPHLIRRTYFSDSDKGVKFKYIVDERWSSYHYMYQLTIPAIERWLAEGTLNPPVTIEETITITTQDVHLERILRNIKSIRGVQKVEVHE